MLTANVNSWLALWKSWSNNGAGWTDILRSWAIISDSCSTLFGVWTDVWKSRAIIAVKRADVRKSYSENSNFDDKIAQASWRASKKRFINVGVGKQFVPISQSCAVAVLKLTQSDSGTVSKSVWCFEFRIDAVFCLGFNKETRNIYKNFAAFFRRLDLFAKILKFEELILCLTVDS